MNRCKKKYATPPSKNACSIRFAARYLRKEGRNLFEYITEIFLENRNVTPATFLGAINLLCPQLGEGGHKCAQNT